MKEGVDTDCGGAKERWQRLLGGGRGEMWSGIEFWYLYELMILFSG
jgi:hypothetical protein